MSGAPILLEMRSITKEFPGVKALSDVNLVVARRRDPRDLRRERRRQVHADEGAQRASTRTAPTTGDIVYQGAEARFSDIRRQRARRHRDHPPGARADPRACRSPRTSSSATSRAGCGAIDWKAAQTARPLELLARVGLERGPRHPDQGHRRRQAAARRDRQGVRQGRQAAHPRRADRGAERGRLAAPARPDARASSERGITSIMISHKLNEIEADRRLDHDPPRRQDDRDARRQGRRRRRGPDHPRHGRPRRSSSRFPDHTPKIGEVFFEVRDWTVRHPISAERLVCKDSNFTVRRGEIVGFAGLMGAGRTELAMSIFGRSYGTFVSRPDHQGRQGDRAQERVATRSTHGLAYVSEDRKAIGLNLLDDIKTLDGRGQALQDLQARRASTSVEEYQVAEALPQEPAHQDADRRRGRRQALRRQPAEGRAGEVDVHRPRPADPRRAHPRHRRGREVRDLRHHPAARRRRARASSSSPPSCPSCSASPTASTPSSKAPITDDIARPRRRPGDPHEADDLDEEDGRRR